MIQNQSKQQQTIPVVHLDHLDALSWLSRHQTDQFEKKIKFIQDKEEFFFYKEQVDLIE